MVLQRIHQGVLTMLRTLIITILIFGEIVCRAQDIQTLKNTIASLSNQVAILTESNLFLQARKPRVISPEAQHQLGEYIVQHGYFSMKVSIVCVGGSESSRLSNNIAQLCKSVNWEIITNGALDTFKNVIPPGITVESTRFSSVNQPKQGEDVQKELRVRAISSELAQQIQSITKIDCEARDLLQDGAMIGIAPEDALLLPRSTIVIWIGPHHYLHVL